MPTERFRTAKVFDYENRTTFNIRVQVADEQVTNGLDPRSLYRFRYRFS